jgi:hypothetical protein
MKRVELYQKVRRAVMVDKMSRRSAARYFGIDRKTVDNTAGCHQHSTLGSVAAAATWSICLNGSLPDLRGRSASGWTKDPSLSSKVPTCGPTSMMSCWTPVGMTSRPTMHLRSPSTFG